MIQIVLAGPCGNSGIQLVVAARVTIVVGKFGARAQVVAGQGVHQTLEATGLGAGRGVAGRSRGLHP